jgi:hypothetical protein
MRLDTLRRLAVDNLCRAKAELEPPKWGKGKGESFSKTFIEPYKYSGLDVSATKHRFLKELDGTGR